MLMLSILTAAVGLLAGLLIAEKKKSLKGKLLSKPFLSALFITTALVQPHPIPEYYGALLAGLALCLCGDVLLALPRQSMFTAGLIAFLLGHLLYGTAFMLLTPLSGWPSAGAWIILAASACVYLWLHSHLEAMKGPVLAYIVVISVMLVGALAVCGDERYPRGGRLLIIGGALCFYLSDLFVARNRFVTPGFPNRLIGLPLYYTGQFLLAFSVGAVG